MIEITKRPLSPTKVINRVRRSSYGAVVTFLGTVRDFSEGKEVLYLEYEVYKGMVKRKMEAIAQEILARWQTEAVSISHRVGKVKAGEIALIIAVATPHRQEAFAACQYAIERLKEIVPIWKKEVYRESENCVEQQR